LKIKFFVFRANTKNSQFHEVPIWWDKITRDENINAFGSTMSHSSISCLLRNVIAKSHTQKFNFTDKPAITRFCRPLWMF